MPNIVRSTDDFRRIHDAYEHAFEKNCSPSFHNLLWQIIVDDRFDERLVAFVPVIKQGRTEIGVAEFNESGYIVTNVGATVQYKELADICDELNKELFGLTPLLSSRIQMSSMRKGIPSDEETVCSECSANLAEGAEHYLVCSRSEK